MRKWVSQRQISTLAETRLSYHLNRLLQNCSNSRALKQGKQVHQQIILHGLDSDPYLTTKLIQIYVDCDDSGPALHLFDELPQPNVFAWTAILAVHLRNGNYKECLQMYREMRVQGVRPDMYVFPKLLKVCSQLSDLEEGTQIHGDVIRFGAGSSLHVCNSLIDMYSKCRSVNEARQVFIGMVERDVLSWNSMISGYICNGFLDSALELLSLMELEGLEPDLITWNTIMDAYSRMGLCEAASEIFDRIAEPNIISWTTLILGYSRSGKHEKALCIFRDMIRRGFVLPDSDTLSCVLSSCRQLAALRSGQEIHGYGLKIRTGLGFYDSAGAALLTMYAWCKRIQDARNVFEMMDKRDVITWNSMILGFSHLGMHNSATEHFSDMQMRGVRYDQITIATVLPVCDLKTGKQIHAHVIKKHFNLPILVWNALINMYAKSGCIGAAYAIFSKMGARDVVSWNAMIGGYGMHGHGRAALQLLQEMKQSGIRPNSVTYTSVLSACSHSGLVDEGLQLFDSLTRDFNFTPSMEQFACVVDLLARAGRLQDAVDFINKMPIDPDGSIWGALLAACRIHQNIQFGGFAAEHLFRLEPDNPGNYVTLSNIYARAGRWDDAVRVRKLMEGRGLIKPSGYSWIKNEK
ncbi:pentatricopeptide repeat-containing protein DOT4, chloroplastic-like [Magnolia sinica]|uniref:pentatricopeptide repeat-containing protein DOT4, chloroplastic-like n=1 Tax=Magnolia sinica TaxID=86752 RepID=UPI00265B3EBA|nr:pentatricopeptide repeat-containing protein DOT4, chloroplastic-like [Magnolia sinica]